MGAKSFIPTAAGMPKVKRSLSLRGAETLGREVDTHIGLERRPRLPFFPMTGVPKCSGLVSGSLSSVCGGRKQHSLSTRRQRSRMWRPSPTAWLPLVNRVLKRRREGPLFRRRTARYSLRSPQSGALLSGTERNASGSSRRRRRTLRRGEKERQAAVIRCARIV